MKNATRVFASTFGTIMALAGIEHGIGEVLQGSVAPSGVMFPSWSNSAFFRNLAGEPAMTIIPNLLITGALAIFPPVLGVLIGAVATWIHAPISSKVHRFDGFRRFLAKLWPWSYTACIISWLSMFPGVALLGYFFGMNNSTVILVILFFALGTLLLTAFSGFAYDIQMQAGT